MQLKPGDCLPEEEVVGRRLEALGTGDVRHDLRGRPCPKSVLVLATIATMGLAARDSSVAQVFANSLDRLAIKLTETINTVARATGQATEKLTELERHMI